MLGLLQRVQSASVVVAGKSIGTIEAGVLVFLGIEKTDTTATADKLIAKLLAYRLFADGENKMNCNIQQVNGGILVVSQFTLVADTHKGLRPSFSCAATPAIAETLYNYFIQQLRLKHTSVATGAFGADMQVSLINDGPVTFILQIK